jgi:uncharacterized protein YjeT (DUF2065 family)
MSDIITAIGLVFVIEGLIYALWPGGMKQMLEMMREMPDESLRNTGLAAVAFGVAIVWLARTFIAGS